ncbi:MAG: MBL fold metallo-hydrolase, partial [Duncaniella sp.]|nr:MBL fold metallo-hydrolase [Duncaniella sp.]
LRDNGITMEMVAGIILTHDHHDHIAQAYPLLRNNRHMRLYCTPRAFNGILRRHNISRRIKDYHTPIYKEFPFKIGNFEITPFEVMHDGADNAGFHITHGERRITVATDLGCISPRVDHYMRLADTIVIESNYDLQMLRTGRYPEYLKARIVAENGHLDNTVTASFLASIVTPVLRRVYLCHLSHDNNTPEIATATVLKALGPDAHIPVTPLPRYEATTLYIL